MASSSTNPLSTHKAPWHLWLVGVLALLWNGSGAYTIFMAQAGRLSVSPDEAAYYAAQAAWFVVLTDAALVSAIAALLPCCFVVEQPPGYLESRLRQAWYPMPTT